MNFPFTPSPQYTAIALAYQNKELIADLVLPRTPVNERSFKWDLHAKSDMFTVPDTRVGRKGMPGEVEFTAAEQTSSVLDYGLDDVVPQEDIESARGKGLDPLGRATEGLTELLMLAREKRVADLVFTAANYPAGSKVTLDANNKWSAFTDAASDPVEDILSAAEGMLMKPNTLVLGSQVWFQLRRHPKVLAAVFPVGGNAASGGVASLQAVSDLFEIDRILIGKAFINTAVMGQTASYGRVWGKQAALLRINPLAGVRGNDISFGMTAEYGTRIAGNIAEPKVGLRGAQRVRAGESVKELITASDCGYLFDAAVA
jgi:hypothetical protein